MTYRDAYWIGGLVKLLVCEPATNELGSERRQSQKKHEKIRSHRNNINDGYLFKIKEITAVVEMVFFSNVTLVEKLSNVAPQFRHTLEATFLKHVGEKIQ